MSKKTNRLDREIAGRLGVNKASSGRRKNHLSAKDFDRSLVSALNKRGIYFYDSTWLPGQGGSFANGERGYILDDNGTSRIRSYAQVREMANDRR